MSVKILEPGLLATIQDLGRYGSQKYGVIVGGAMDTLATRISNILVGNKEGKATIEVTLFGTELQFEKDYLVAITGGDLKPTIDGEKMPMWQPVLIRKGQVLKFNYSSAGCRAYIAFAGGLRVPIVMGSKSTYIQAKIGGYKGRELRKGDILSCGLLSELSKLFINQLKSLNNSYQWYVNHSLFHNFHKVETIRLLEGTEFERFDGESQQAFLNETYKLTKNANRMGYQLEGTELTLTNKFELLSEGVTYGTIQVPANGQPIVLMAERQTIGGYPKIGQVISVDLPRLAQLKPGNSIRFELISIEKAEKLLFKQERHMQLLKMGIYLKAHNEYYYKEEK